MKRTGKSEKSEELTNEEVEQKENLAIKELEAFKEKYQLLGQKELKEVFEKIDETIAKLRKKRIS